MATTVAKDVSLSLGLLQCVVSMSSALEPTVSNTNVCTGHGKHAATKITTKNNCAHCGEVAYADIEKAREVAGAYVLLSAEDLASATADVTHLKKSAALTAHPAEQVDLHTTTGEKLYYLKPSVGGEQVYAVLYSMVAGHPEVTFLTQWAPRTKAATFALKAFNGALCLQERTRQSALREAPAVQTEAPAPLLALAEQYLAMESVVSDFDPATYEDSFEAKIAEILATRTPVQLEVANTEAVVTSGSNPMEALQAMLAPAPTKRPARKKVATG